jgi:DNA polymerase delta subunit 1
MSGVGGAKRPADGPEPPARRRPPPGDDDLDLMDAEDFALELEPPEEEELPAGGAELEEGALGEAGKNWRRPPAAPLDAAAAPLVFQSLEVDAATDRPHAAYYPAGGAAGLQEAPTLRMFGVTAAGCSVCVFVHGFEPYFYVPAPPGFSPDDAAPAAEAVNAAIAGRDKAGRNARRCLRVELVSKQTLMYYQPAKSAPFLKIVIATPNLMAPARSALEEGVFVPGLPAPLGRGQTFESNVPYPLRFMVDVGLVGGGWVELPAGSYRPVPPAAQASHCQLEAHCAWSTLVAHAPEGEWARIAPLRVLSLDIECQGRKGHFPEAKHDPVIQIASLVSVFGEARPAVKNVMTLRSCAPITGAEVMSFEREADLLMRWRDLLVETDPDVVIGYNTANFDLPYLLDRATALGVPQFWAWGRLRGRRARMRDARFSSKAYGTHDYKEITIEGRVQLDLLQAIQRDHKLSSYSLNSVSAHFLGEQKEDVHHSDISKLQDGTAESRRRLAVYCLKDAYLPQRLVEKLMYVPNFVEMARVTGVPMTYLLARGQSVKVFSQILRKAATRGLVVPNLKGGGGPEGGGVAYEGATVLEPKAGYYDRPVATLDFASLYPSIMMAHNLCYTTLVPRELHSRVDTGPGGTAVRTPNGDVFVRPELASGLLPEILTELLSARKRARKDMEAATDPSLRAVFNGRQMALKVSANSVYGFTGATVGTLPCLEISSSTTAFGRQMIDHTRAMVMQKYCRANGYSHDAGAPCMLFCCFEVLYYSAHLYCSSLTHI